MEGNIQKFCEVTRRYPTVPIVLPNFVVHGFDRFPSVFHPGLKSDSPPPPRIASVRPLEMKYSKPPSPVMAARMISRGNRVKTDNLVGG